MELNKAIFYGYDDIPGGFGEFLSVTTPHHDDRENLPHFLEGFCVFFRRRGVLWTDTK